MAMKNNSSVPLPRWPVLLVLCMAISAVALPKSAQAQDWKFEPIVRVGGEYDDNARLAARTDQEVELAGYLLDLKADIKYFSQTTSFFLKPRALLRNYPNDSEFDSDDYFLQSQFNHQGRSSTIGFRADYDQQSVRTGERSNVDFEVDDPDEIANDDSGRAFLSGTRSGWRLSPYWDYQLSDISTIGAQIRYVDVQYDDVFAGLLTDYSDARLNLNYSRRFSNVNTALLTVTARRYDADDAFDPITGYGVMAGFEHTLSEKMRLKAMFGFEDAEQSGFQYDPEPVGYVTLTRSLETILLFAQYRRSISGTGAGRISVRDSFNLNFQRRLSERIAAKLGVSAYQTTDVGDLTFFDDRNYVQLRSSFLWYLSRSLVIEAVYSYTIEDRDEIIGGRANSNQVNLWFTYQPKTTPKL